MRPRSWWVIVVIEFLQRAQLALASEPYSRRLGLRVLAAGEGTAMVALAYAPEHSNTLGKVHGGVLASVMHAAVRVAAWSSDRREEVAGGTWPSGRPLALDVTYLAPAAREEVVARATVLARGRTTVQLGVDVAGEQGTRHVASGHASYQLRMQGADPFSNSDSEPLTMPEPSASLQDWQTLQRHSPYIRAMGVEVLSCDRTAAVMHIPLAGNEARAGTVDEGALAGCIDSCAAFAARAHLANPLPRKASTLAMSLVFAAEVTGGALVTAHLVGRSDDCYISRVEARRASDARLAALATVTYRFAD